MRFFYDTEFIEDGETIELISIGIVGTTDASTTPSQQTLTRRAQGSGCATTC